MGKQLNFLCDFCGEPFKIKTDKGFDEKPHGTLQWRKPNTLTKNSGFFIQWKLCDPCWDNIRPLLTTKLGRPDREKVEA